MAVFGVTGKFHRCDDLYEKDELVSLKNQSLEKLLCSILEVLVSNKTDQQKKDLMTYVATNLPQELQDEIVAAVARSEKSSVCMCCGETERSSFRSVLRILNKSTRDSVKYYLGYPGNISKPEINLSLTTAAKINFSKYNRSTIKTVSLEVTKGKTISPEMLQFLTRCNFTSFRISQFSDTLTAEDTFITDLLTILRSQPKLKEFFIANELTFDPDVLREIWTCFTGLTDLVSLGWEGSAFSLLSHLDDLPPCSKVRFVYVLNNTGELNQAFEPKANFFEKCFPALDAIYFNGMDIAKCTFPQSEKMTSLYCGGMKLINVNPMKVIHDSLPAGIKSFYFMAELVNLKPLTSRLSPMPHFVELHFDITRKFFAFKDFLLFFQLFPNLETLTLNLRGILGFDEDQFIDTVIKSKNSLSMLSTLRIKLSTFPSQMTGSSVCALLRHLNLNELTNFHRCVFAERDYRDLESLANQKRMKIIEGCLCKRIDF